MAASVDIGCDKSSIQSCMLSAAHGWNDGELVVVAQSGVARAVSAIYGEGGTFEHRSNCGMQSGQALQRDCNGGTVGQVEVQRGGVEALAEDGEKFYRHVHRG